MYDINITIPSIINLYLYGSDDIPNEIQDRLRDVDEDYKIDLPVFTTSFMSTVGRYAVPARSKVVDDFFSGQISQSYGITNQQGVTTLLISDYLNQTGKTSDELIFQVSNYTTDVISADFKERAFIWGTSYYTINQDAVLIWDNGNLSIEGITVRPQIKREADDDFNFIGSSSIVNQLNVLFESIIDPYGIGRTVNFEFNNSPGPIYSEYTMNDYNSHKALISSWTSLVDAALLASSFESIVDYLLDNNNINYYDDEGRFIIYGSMESESLSASDAAGPDAGQLGAETGFAIVGGGGNDQIDGSVNSDALYGGNGEDILSGGDGDDVLNGGAGNDELYGDDGSNTIFGDDGDDIIVSSGFDEIFGGEGSDEITVTEDAIWSYVSGGAGDDFIYVENNNLTVVFMAGDGVDTIEADQTFAQDNPLYVETDITPENWLITVDFDENSALYLSGDPDVSYWAVSGSMIIRSESGEIHISDLLFDVSSTGYEAFTIDNISSVFSDAFSLYDIASDSSTNLYANNFVNGISDYSAFGGFELV